MENESEAQEEKEVKVRVDTGSSKLSRLRRTVHVEPYVFLFSFGCTGLMPILTSLAYRKLCLTTFNSSVEICDNLDNQNYSDEEDVVQKQTAIWVFRINLCYEIPSILTCFLYGSVSDNVGRKVALLLPAFGQMLSCTSHLLQSLYMDLPVAGMLIGPVISGSCGGWISANMAYFSYIGDATSTKQRTLRIAIGEALVHVGFCAGLLVFGAMLDTTGYTACLALTLGVFLTILLFVFVWVGEPMNGKSRERSGGASCRSVCSLKSLQEGAACITKNRPDRGRCHLLILFFILFSAIIGGIPMMILGYLYVTKQPLSFSNTLFGLWSSVTLLLGSLGVVVMIPVLKTRLHMRETSIMLLAQVSTSTALTLYAFSTKTWMPFAASALAFLSFFHFPVIRSLLSKLVEKYELGRIFAMFGTMQSVSGMVANSMYTNVYAYTLYFWASFPFLLGACLMIIPAIATLSVIYYCRILRRRLTGWDGDAPGHGKDRNNVQDKNEGRELEILPIKKDVSDTSPEKPELAQRTDTSEGSSK